MDLNLANEISRHLTNEDLLVILAAARIGLADAETFDHLGSERDLGDKEMLRVRESLREFMSNEPFCRPDVDEMATGKGEAL